MKLTLASLFITFAIATSGPVVVAAQSSPPPTSVATPAATPVQPDAVPMGEDDRIPFMQQNPPAYAPEASTGGLMLKTLGSMIIIVGLIFAGAWLARKFGVGVFGTKEGEQTNDLAVLQTVSLGAGRTVSTVRFGERVLLVGSTPQSIALLAEDEKPAPVTRSVAEMLGDDAGFAEEFNRATERLDDHGGQAS